MAAFPSIPIINPFAEELGWKTLASQFDDQGTEKRRQKWLFPKRNVTLKCNWISKSDALTLYNFYNARKGAFEAFNYFFPYFATYVGEYVGVGDDSTVLFNLPSKQATSYTLYVAGAAMSPVTEYTFWSAGGTDGADKVTFGVAPDDGDIITWSFTGYLKLRCRFFEDSLSFEMFYNRLVNVGLKLKGILNA